jgi:hypothetical protein
MEESGYLTVKLQLVSMFSLDIFLLGGKPLSLPRFRLGYHPILAGCSNGKSKSALLTGWPIFGVDAK